VLGKDFQTTKTPQLWTDRATTTEEAQQVTAPTQKWRFSG
jgi:hypothetical protein